MDTLIEVKNLRFKNQNKTILHDISFDVVKGEKYLILGHNGSGKSLLIDCILDNINYKGSIIKKTLSNDRIGVLYDQFATFPLLKVKEILSLLESMYSTVRSHHLIEQLGIEPLFNKFFKVLSKGEKKKIGLYAVLFAEKDLLILDEPTDGLDPEIRDVFWNLINTCDKTVLLTTHIWEEGKVFADKIIFLENGVILNKAQSYQELITNFPFKGKVVTASEPKDSDFVSIKVDDQNFIYFKNQGQKELIINKVSNSDYSGYSVMPIDLKDVYLNLRHNSSRSKT